mgnify:CR=1 FL=1
MKKIIFICSFIFWLIGVEGADNLKIYVDGNRFLTKNGNTRFEFNYKILYKNLEFTKNPKNFSAKLKIEMSLLKDGKIAKQLEFENNIVEENRNVTNSRLGYYIDKLFIVLSKPGFSINLNFMDEVSGKNFKWTQSLELLKTEELSDIEFSLKTEKGDKKSKFARDSLLFYVSPAHIYNKEYYQDIVYYYNFLNKDSFKVFQEKVTLNLNDKIIKEITNSFSSNEKLVDRYNKFSLSELEEGYYNIEIKVKPKESDKWLSRTDYLILKDEEIRGIRIFTELEDEIKLIKYFLPSSRTKIWKTLSEKGKKNFVYSFWKENDLNPNTEENEFLDIVKERIEYVNKFYSSFKFVWKNDMGRIYIRNGKPNEIEKDRTDSSALFPDREYQIWRYYSGESRVYLFLDTDLDGSYHLIYSKNDENESSLTDWQRYMSDDFDPTLLE